jgi:hypothetical protein
MNKLLRITSTTTALAFTTLLGASVAAQQPTPSPAPDPRPAPQPRTAQPDQPKAATSIKGELIKVDPSAKMLTIKTAQGKTEMVAYNDATQVTGAESGIAGLVNQSSTKVTVKFTGPDIARMATEIVVEKEKP